MNSITHSTINCPVSIPNGKIDTGLNVDPSNNPKFTFIVLKGYLNFAAYLIIPRV